MSTKLFYILSTLALATFVVGASYAHDYYMVQERYYCYIETKNGAQCGITEEGMVEGWLGWYVFDEFNGEGK
jgi:hypothetical protein